MSFFRSEPMSLCQMTLHNESAFNCLIELGYVGKVQFRNLHQGTNLTNGQYVAEIRRCQELQRMLQHFQQEIDDFNIKTVYYPNVDEEEMPQDTDLKVLELVIQQSYEEISSVESNITGLRRQRNLLYERQEVVKKVQHFLTGEQYTEAVMAWSDSMIMNLIHDELRPLPRERLHLSFLAGTVPLNRFQAFELMLWRITHGNFFLKHSEIRFPQEEATGELFHTRKKYAFMVFFVGPAMRDKIAKVCQGFEVKLFPSSESSSERLDECKKITAELLDLDRVLEQSQKHRFRILLIAAADLYIWRVKVKKILMVYDVLNRMGHVRHLHMGKYLQAECWIPTKDMEKVKNALAQGIRRTSRGNPRSMFIPILNVIHKKSLTDSDKPTHFELNHFTQGFQSLIDAYGIAAYQELNPAPYTIVTFPFLFAIMFGDMGHALLMLIFGWWMVIYEKSLEEKKRSRLSSSEIWNILFAGRYIITLMGGFSLYTGLIYNDCFSKSFNIFGSAWSIQPNETRLLKDTHLQLDPALPQHFRGTPYVMGFDPVWDAAGENAITTSNSFKMKLAIILGVAQMIFGLILSAVNYTHKRDYTDLILIFIPQLTFLLSIFAYLVFLIFYKWSQYGGHNPPPYNTACAPSILIMFINMLLMKGPAIPPPGCEVWMFDAQDLLQTVLLTLAFICIPVLLAGKPIWFMLQRKKIRKIKNEALRKSRTRDNISNIRKSLIYNVESSGFLLSASRTAKSREMETQDVGELWIHSGIHCIESVLGSVSHTASYLRLWALSLAHDQLSSVLWEMVLKMGLKANYGYWNSLILVVAFVLWATLTLAILVVMEGLSAFLHTLRLHWVEFQSKFYEGSGEMFTPFKFEQSTFAD